MSSVIDHIKDIEDEYGSWEKYQAFKELKGSEKLAVKILKERIQERFEKTLETACVLTQREQMMLNIAADETIRLVELIESIK